MQAVKDKTNLCKRAVFSDPSLFIDTKNDTNECLS